MSWSRKGRGALAVITAIMINGEMEGWMTSVESAIGWQADRDFSSAQGRIIRVMLW